VSLCKRDPHCDWAAGSAGEVMPYWVRAVMKWVFLQKSLWDTRDVTARVVTATNYSE
jgi:hypothetical protein